MLSLRGLVRRRSSSPLRRRRRHSIIIIVLFVRRRASSVCKSLTPILLFEGGGLRPVGKAYYTNSTSIHPLTAESLHVQMFLRTPINASIPPTSKIS